MIAMYVTGPPPKMVDVACYLTHNRYQQDRENVMRRASEAGIQFLQPIPHFFYATHKNCCRCWCRHRSKSAFKRQ